MTRDVIDAATLVHLVGHGTRGDPAHQLVAPSPIRSKAPQLLVQDVRDGRLSGIVPLAAVEDLAAP